MGKETEDLKVGYNILRVISESTNCFYFVLFLTYYMLNITQLVLGVRGSVSKIIIRDSVYPQ